MSLEAIRIIDALASLSRGPGFGSDERAKVHALQLSRQLISSLQKPEDAAMELCFHPMFTAAARVAIDLKLFHLIARSSRPVSVSTLASASSASEALIIRLLRPLSSLGFVQETGHDHWTASAITKAMCAPPIEAAHIHFWDQGTRCATSMSPFFKTTGYHQPEDPRKGIFQFASQTDKEAFEVWNMAPEVMTNFNIFMTGVRGSRPSWVEWWPVEAQIFQGAAEDDASVLLVDVAGGRGHDVQAFKDKFPNQKGRIVLEDLPVVIDDIKQLDGDIERVKYDFFTPQPILGARIYFFHFIMHDWSDDVCLKILGHTTAVMKKGYSKLLLNEFILPDEGCPLFLSGFDLQMMTMHAGQERTKTQWEALLSTAGFRINKFWVPENSGEGVIEAELS
ncbi:sterigmatocystin 8-O-methyltransferase [Biscogniauxia marginata]|nr:sterigmatocystin 8-O-methyltransferase [Biscogniauxia marginata]